MSLFNRAATLVEATEVDKTGRVACGVFIPLPDTLARRFPSKAGEDDSVPHITVLYIGDVTPSEQKLVVGAVARTLRDWPPFRVDVSDYAEFINDKDQTIAHMAPTATIPVMSADGDLHYRTLGELHADLYSAIEEAGVKVGHTYGPKTKAAVSERADLFKSHTTLAYVNKGEPAYSGPKPTGTFMVTAIEVWGWEKYQLPLGKTTAAQPAPVGMLPAPPFGSSMIESAVASPASDKAKHDLYHAIAHRSGQLVGKELHLIFPKHGPKGLDAAFKEGGSFKIRPKEGGVVVVKLQGLPSDDSRFIGVGNSIGAALAAMKPEHEHMVQQGQAAEPLPASPKPPADKEFKPSSTATPTSPGATTPADVGVAIAPKAPEPKAPEPKAENPKKAPPQKGPAREVIGGQALHNDMGVDQETFDTYARALALASELLKRRGFGFLLGRTTMHLRKGKSGVLGNYTGAEAATLNPEVEIFPNNFGNASVADIAVTMVHELGHHYYYKEIPRALRKTYGWYFDKAWGDAGIPDSWEKKKLSPGEKSKKIHAAMAAGKFPSAYGATKRYEDFAEIFAAFIGRGTKLADKKQYQLTPDTMQRFRTFLSQDKRINLKAEWLLGRRDLAPITEANQPQPPMTEQESALARLNENISWLTEANGEGGTGDGGAPQKSVKAKPTPGGDAEGGEEPEGDQGGEPKAKEKGGDSSEGGEEKVDASAEQFSPIHRHGHAALVGVEHGKPINLPPEAIAELQQHAKHGVHHEGPELDGEPGVHDFVQQHLGGKAKSWDLDAPQPNDHRWLPELALSLFGGDTDQLHHQVTTHENFDPKKSVHDNLVATADAWHHPEMGHHVTSHDLNHIVKSVSDDKAANEVTADAANLHKLLHGPMEGFKKFHKAGFSAMFPHDSGFHEHHTKIARIADMANTARDAHLAHQMRTKGGVYFAGKDHVGAVASRLARKGASRLNTEGEGSLFDRVTRPLAEDIEWTDSEADDNAEADADYLLWVNGYGDRGDDETGSDGA